MFHTCDEWYFLNIRTQEACVCIFSNQKRERRAKRFLEWWDDVKAHYTVARMGAACTPYTQYAYVFWYEVGISIFFLLMIGRVGDLWGLWRICGVSHWHSFVGVCWDGQQLEKSNVCVYIFWGGEENVAN
jgi:hypothetical protein